MGISGSTFRATNVHNGQVVALKVQSVDVSYPSNPHERQIYPLLQGGVGMPTLWASGVWGRWDYLAMDLLGSSLDRLYRKAGKGRLDLRSVCTIAIQLVCTSRHIFFLAALIPSDCTCTDLAPGVHALARRAAQGRAARQLRRWARAKTRDDIHDRFWICKAIP